MEGLDQRASYHRLVPQDQVKSFPKPARLLLMPQMEESQSLLKAESQQMLKNFLLQPHHTLIHLPIQLIHQALLQLLLFQSALMCLLLRVLQQQLLML